VEEGTGRVSSSASSISSQPKVNGAGDENQMLDELLIVDYRYSRFALDTRTGLFNMIRCFFIHYYFHSLKALQGLERSYVDWSVFYTRRSETAYPTSKISSIWRQ
jgi:hypothetical protein